jgi:hypothetical protein
VRQAVIKAKKSEAAGQLNVLNERSGDGAKQTA